MYPDITSKKRFYLSNKKIWRNDNYIYKNEKECIYVVHTLSYHFQYNVLLDLVSKGLQKKHGLPIYALSVGERYYSFVEGDKSFGIDAFYIDDNKLINEYALIYKEEINKIVNKLYKNKDELLKFKYKGISCGDCIWDYILGITLEYDSISREHFKSIIEKTVGIVEIAFSAFKIHKPAYVVVDEAVRLEGLYANVAMKYGAKVVMPNLSSAYHFVMDSKDKKICKIAQRRGEAILNYAKSEGFKSKNKFLYDAPEKKLENSLLKNGKKNAFIFLHVFSDAPRVSYNNKIYTDYVEWFKETLKIVNQIEGVNWIVRDHPGAKGSKQPLFIKKICEQYGNKNIIMSEDGMSREDIIKEADVVITCAGDVGLEYWACGIPTIMLAESFYNKYGISYLMHDKEEYKSTLQNLDALKKPSKESVQLAQEIISKFQSSMEITDSLMGLFKDIRNKEIKGIRLEYRDYDLYNYEFIKRYIELIDSDKIKSSSCYTLDYLMEE